MMLKPGALDIMSNVIQLGTNGCSNSIHDMFLILKKNGNICSQQGITDCFQIGKGVHQGCILSPCKMPAAAAAKSLQSCPTLCNSRDSSPSGCPIPGILQARILEWVAISFSNAWKWKVKVKSLSHIRFLATPWTAAYQAPPSMGFSRHERVLEWVAIAFSITNNF